MRKSSSKQSRKFFALSLFLAALAVVGSQPSREAPAQVTPTLPKGTEDGYVLRAGEGEILKRGKGNTITIKVDPKTGSPNMALGTQALDPGVGIPLHRHEHEDEVLFVHEGSGVAISGDRRQVVEKGDTIYIPHGVWHGVETKQQGINLLWVVTPPGLEGFFREISSAPGIPPKSLTPSQIQDIGRKHGVHFKPH